MKRILQTIIAFYFFFRLASSVQFVIQPEKEICIIENVPLNQHLATEVRLEHSKQVKDYNIQMLYLNDKGEYMQTVNFKTKYYSHVYIHDQNGPLYVCFSSDSKRRIRANVQINLMIPDIDTLPSKEDGEELNRAIFTTNSKMMELINEQMSFAKEESNAQEANLRTQKSLRLMLFIEICVVAFLGLIQYLLMKNFVKGINPV